MKTPTVLASEVLEEYRHGDLIFDREDVLSLIQGAVMLDRADLLDFIQKLSTHIAEDPNFSQLNTGALLSLEKLKQSIFTSTIN